VLHKTDTNIVRLKNDIKSREAWRVNGILRKYYVRCGKKNCHCLSGKKHGAYWYLVWDEGFRTCKRYVKKKDLDVIRSAIKRGHEWKQSVRQLQQRLRMNSYIAMQVVNALDRNGEFMPFIKKKEDVEFYIKELGYALSNTPKITKLNRWYVIEKDQKTTMKVCFWGLRRIYERDKYL